MLKLVLAVGLLAGLAAGLATAVLQHFTTVPLIMAAEVFERASSPDGDGAAHDHGASDHGAGAATWSPADGLERTLSTGTATVISAVGFALVLIAVMLLASEEITPTSALAYAAAGFAATGLATGIGLPPELPGSAAGDLLARQAWWFGAAVATAAGLFLLLKRRGALAKAAGALLLVAPHAIGAPAGGVAATGAPAELAAHFASTSIGVHAAFWALVGTAVGVFWRRLSQA
jgi:cobalt transporter subunit CbtA